MSVIEDAYRRAARIISPDLASTYSEHLASKAPEDDDAEEALIEAHTVVAALVLFRTSRTISRQQRRNWPTSGSRSTEFRSKV